MNYTLLFYLSPDEFAARTDSKKKEAFWASFLPYTRFGPRSTAYSGADFRAKS